MVLKNKKLFGALVIILLIVIIVLGRSAYKIKAPQSEKTLVTVPPPRMPTRPEVEKIEPEKEEINRHLTIEKIRQIQLEKLKESIQTKDSDARPGKYPSIEELEKMEEEEAVLY